MYLLGTAWKQGVQGVCVAVRSVEYDQLGRRVAVGRVTPDPHHGSASEARDERAYRLALERHGLSVGLPFTLPNEMSTSEAVAATPALVNQVLKGFGVGRLSRPANHVSHKVRLFVE